MTSNLVEGREAFVLVLGDLSRSPRMLNHARELIAEGYQVKLIGYRGEVDRDLRASKRLSVHFIESWSVSSTQRWVGAFALTVRTILLSLSLAFILGRLMFGSKAQKKLLLVQTPPAFPTLGVAALFCWLSSCRLVVDWHNLGHTLLQSRPAIVQSIYQRIEYALGRICCSRRDWLYLCVSMTMKKWLELHFHARPQQVICVYDRPNKCIKPLNSIEAEQRCDSILARVGVTKRGQHVFVSSTSWTEDEDFGLLLKALKSIDESLKAKGSDTRATVIVTGKGRLRGAFEAEAASLGLKHFDIQTAWLDVDVYHELLSVASLGICLHTSSSGLDLPMKAVDMLGSGLPVCAYRYPCLNELLVDPKHGAMFETADGLASMIKDVLAGGSAFNVQAARDWICKNPLSSCSEEWQKFRRALNL